MIRVAVVGTGGIATADGGGGAVDVAYSLAIAPDGSIVVGGSTTTQTDTGFAFARFTSDGNQDPFFGTNGVALFANGTGGNVVGAIAIDPTGRTYLVMDDIKLIAESFDEALESLVRGRGQLPLP